MTSVFVQRATAEQASAWCSVCSTTTDFHLEPRRAA
jgi:hypothetical protein